MPDLRDELKSEYSILQTQYDAFDGRALTIKSWSAPLLAAGVGAGLQQSSIGLLFATVVAALSLWWLEGLWKSFQYCYADRIKTIENWFRSDQPEEIKPYQIYTSWGEVWSSYYRTPRAMMRIVRLRFVYLPYAPIALIAILGMIWITVRPS